MIRLSRKSIFALEAVVDIACNARPEPVQAKEITKRQGIPQRYLENVMQSLVHAGILRGVRGPRGGYRLGRERRKITAAEIVRLVAQIEQAEDGDGSGAAVPAMGRIVGPVVEELQAELMARLETLTIEDLCRRAEAAGLAEPADPAADFAI
ncbi:MAG TPA: transcriptional regulator [Alphaproteobacteria bacterium]|nr:transcriptional regulator [Alphaproteobacteria bacterium]HAJ48318.1 transcriptional regulator [Alphaproteobacteria bacterium]